MPALVDLVASQMARHPDAAVERCVLGTGDPDEVAQRFADWCREQLAADVVDAWLWSVSVGVVAGVALDDGRDVVVKAYAPDRSVTRLTTVVSVQRLAADAGLPAPRPVVGPAPLGLGWATAETALNVGRRPNLVDVTDRATAAAGWVRVADALQHAAPMLESTTAAPRVARGLYPVPHSPLFDFDATSDGAEWIDELAASAWLAMNERDWPRRVVHTDWRGDNFRVNQGGSEVVAVFDWDSIRVEPEVLSLGHVAAMHSVDWSTPGGPYFATGDECVAFVEAVEHARRSSFSPSEWRGIRAAIVYGWCYTARCEHARARVGGDKPQFKMRDRLRANGASLLASA